jgi:hypothetical protein
VLEGEADLEEQLRRLQLQNIRAAQQRRLEERVVRALYKKLLPEERPSVRRTLEMFYERAGRFPHRISVRRASLAKMLFSEIFAGKGAVRWWSWLDDAIEEHSDTESWRVAVVVGPVVGVPGGLITLRALYDDRLDDETICGAAGQRLLIARKKSEPCYALLEPFAFYLDWLAQRYR